MYSTVNAALNRAKCRWRPRRRLCCSQKSRCKRWRKGTNALRCFRRQVLTTPTLPRLSPAKNRRPNKMRRLVLSIFIFTLAIPCARTVLADDHAAAPASSISASDHGDPVLKAMLAELRRSQEKLQLGELQRPYYIDYQVTELQDYQTDAVLGAIRTDQTNIGRFVRVVVRIGDYKQDMYYSEGMGAMEILPMDNNEAALRHQLWLATDKAYKAALSGLTLKQAALKKFQIESEQANVADFSQEKTSESIRDLSG